jgi:hypothetical protein
VDALLEGYHDENGLRFGASGPHAAPAREVASLLAPVNGDPPQSLAGAGEYGRGVAPDADGGGVAVEH